MRRQLVLIQPEPVADDALHIIAVMGAFCGLFADDQTKAQQATQQQTAAAPAKAAAEAALAPASPITVTTDTVKAVIDEKKRRPAPADPLAIQSNR